MPRRLTVHRSPTPERCANDLNRVISVHRWQGSRVFSIVRQTVINALAESATLSGAEIVLNSTAVSVTPDGD